MTNVIFFRISLIVWKFYFKFYRSRIEIFLRSKLMRFFSFNSLRIVVPVCLDVPVKEAISLWISRVVIIFSNPTFFH